MKYAIVWSCLLHGLLLQGSDSQKKLEPVERLECMRRIILRRDERSGFVAITKMIAASFEASRQRNKRIEEMYAGDLHRSWPDEKMVDDTLYQELDREIDKGSVVKPRVYIELQPSDQASSQILRAKIYLQL